MPADTYLDAYASSMDSRVLEDPHEAVGGLWEELGRLQFDYLRQCGLRPEHRLLDIGCGTLRGGRWFIGYLDPGNYTGLEISQEAIKFANDLVATEGLGSKSPRILLNADKRLTFDELVGEAFDFVLAQSVFTHLRSEHIEECFAHLRPILRDRGSFYFTIFEAKRFTERNEFTFAYPFRFIKKVASKKGFAVSKCLDFAHPRGQVMVVARDAKSA